MKYKFVNGLCGAGKTFGLCNQLKVAQHTHASRVIIAVPSLLLANEVYDTFEKIGLEGVILMTSETSENVAQGLTKSIQEINTREQGIIVCTYKGLQIIPYFPNKDEWRLVVDEVPNVDNYYEPIIPYNHPMLTSFIEVEEDFQHDELYKIKIKEGMDLAVEKFLSRNQDDVDNIFKPIIKDLFEGMYEVFCLKEQWDKVVVNNEITDDKDVDTTFGNTKNALSFISIQTPALFEGYKQVMFMGANFEFSKLYYWFQVRHNVEWEQDTTIKLRYNSYDHCASRLTIKYLQEPKWSKYRRDYLLERPIETEAGTFKTAGRYYDYLVQREFRDYPRWLYVINNDYRTDDYSVGESSGTRMPVISHGLNKYQKYNAVYFGPALNKKPNHTKMLMALGFSEAYLSRADEHEIAHQGIMRTNLRDNTSNEEVVAVVVDEPTAQSIARLFSGCQIGPVNGATRRVLVQKKDPYTNQERVKRSKIQKLKQQQLFRAGFDFDNERVSQISNQLGYKGKDYYFGPEIDEASSEGSGEYVCITGLKDRHTKKPTSAAVLTRRDLIKLLQGFATNNIVRTKDENPLFNASCFSSKEGLDTERGLSNVDFSTFILLDIDDGDLNPDEFVKIYNDFSFILMNSFSRCKATPNKYRAIFFVDQPMLADTYNEVALYLVNLAQKHGYLTPHSHQEQQEMVENRIKNGLPPPKFSGIDVSKLHAASFFYPPCVVKDRPEWALFIKHNVKSEREINRYQIKVNNVLTFTIDKFEREQIEIPLVFVTDTNEGTTQEPEEHVTSPAQMKQKIKELRPYCGTHRDYLRFVVAARDFGFTLEDVKELTPFVSRSKTSRDAEQMWHNTKNYDRIHSGSLYYLVMGKNQT